MFRLNMLGAPEVLADLISTLETKERTGMIAIEIIPSNAKQYEELQSQVEKWQSENPGTKKYSSAGGVAYAGLPDVIYQAKRA